MNRLIVGCGFLGWPLALKWAETDSDHVYATTRSKDRASVFVDNGLIPVVADITDVASLKKGLGDLPPIDTIVFAVGMDRTRSNDIFDVYVEGMKRFLDNFPHPVSHLIYVSSTGVYGDFNGDWVDEASPTNPAREGGKACLAAEALLAERIKNWTVLRMAGLYGGERVPTKTLIEKRDWEKLSPHGYLNLIHQNDAVAVIAAAATEKPMQQTFLCSDGNPPVRGNYYQYIADHFQAGKIPWALDAQADPNSRSANSKRIANKKMLKELKLELEHPDFKSGLAASGIGPAPQQPN